MITENVKDALDEGFRCTLMSFYTVKASPYYQLKPTRGQQTQTAFVVIADVLKPGSAEQPPVAGSSTDRADRKNAMLKKH